MRTLYVAAGGGGDAVGALLARRALGDTDERPPLVTTCAWERLRIDPVPGPRARTDFTGLAEVGGEACEVVPTSESIPPGRSVLPRLAETSGARVFLHDFEGGALGLSDQLQRLAASLEVDQLVVVDVGGDIVAQGPEQELRSPLADSLTLAAVLRTGIPASVVVIGPGADAELPEAEVLERFEEIDATEIGYITPRDVETLETVLSWHPTEASALVSAGAVGMRGNVAMRRGREPVPVTDHTPEVWVARDPKFQLFPLARLLSETSSLPHAEDLLRARAVNEIDFERRVALDASMQRPRQPLLDVVSEMTAVGASHITDRRLSERVCLSGLDDIRARVVQPKNGMWSKDVLVEIALSPS